MGERPQVVIVGAGFGGLNAAKALRHAPLDVLMVDANNYHTFQPLLYQVATAALDTGNIAHQVRQIFAPQRNFRFRQGVVSKVDLANNTIHLADGAELGYDHLIIAAGAVYNDFGVKGVREHAFVLKSLGRSAALRSHILRRFEMAAADPSLVEQGALTFVIVGAGPTGVEMAGALVELFQRVLPADYPELDLRLARVVLIEMTSEVLPTFGQASRRYAERELRRRGVDVRLGSIVSEARPDAVVLRSGEVIPSHTLIWAAGIRGHPLGEALGVELTRTGRVVVEPDLSLRGHPNVFVVGDLAASNAPAGRGSETPGGLLPQVAQVAIQGGKHAARNVIKRLQHRATEPLTYRDLGSMAIIGRNAGIAELSPLFLGLRLRGWLGWLGWLFLHLIYLPGFRNRIAALFSWAYNYLTYDRHARLILEPNGSAGWGDLPGARRGLSEKQRSGAPANVLAAETMVEPVAETVAEAVAEAEAAAEAVVAAVVAAPAAPRRRARPPAP